MSYEVSVLSLCDEDILDVLDKNHDAYERLDSAGLIGDILNRAAKYCWYSLDSMDFWKDAIDEAISSVAAENDIDIEIE